MQVNEKHSRIWSLGAVLLLVSACSSEDISDRYVGYVEAKWVYVAAPQSGWLVSANVEEGRTLEAGEVLFQLDTDQQIGQLAEAVARTSQVAAQAKDIGSGARPAEINALLAQQQQAEAGLVLAKSERDRVVPLVATGVITSNRGDQVEAAISGCAGERRSCQRGS
jgi:HlyD family secretion protein